MNVQSAHRVSALAVKSFEVRFDGFEGQPARKGDFIHSPEFTCFGHKWCLELYPGGTTASDDGYVAVFLRHQSEGSIEVQADLIVMAPIGNIGTSGTSVSLGEGAYQSKGSVESAWGRRDFTKRSAIIGSLQNGVLVIQVQMRQSKPTLLPTYLENPIGKMILKRFMDMESADVTFEVGGEQVKSGSGRKKKKKTESTTFPAHRFILQDSAPYLYNLCTSRDGSTAIPIADVKAEIFHHMLYYIYGGKVPEEDLKSNAMEIISAADKYEFVGLKLEAEAVLVNSTTITFDNVMELLLYSVEKNCALLKEAAMDFLVKNKDEVPSKVSFNNAPGHLMNDVFVALNTNDSTRVSTLRERLHAKGLEIDGSREAMIARLRENP